MRSGRSSCRNENLNYYEQMIRHRDPASAWHCTGTVGGKTYGVAKAAKIVSVRGLDCKGGAGSLAERGSLFTSLLQHGDGKLREAVRILSYAIACLVDFVFRGTSGCAIPSLGPHRRQCRTKREPRSARHPRGFRLGRQDPQEGGRASNHLGFNSSWL